MEHQHSLRDPESGPVVQSFGSLRSVRLGLSDDVRHRSVAALNRLLAHTVSLRDLYKKAHWQTSGGGCGDFHTLFDRHYRDQEALADVLAERVQTLGGVARALARDISEESRLSRGPSGSESRTNQIKRLLDYHEFLLLEARPLARDAQMSGDDGTGDVIVGRVLRTNERHSWSLGRNLPDPNQH